MFVCLLAAVFLSFFFFGKRFLETSFVLDEQIKIFNIKFYHICKFWYLNTRCMRDVGRM